MKDERRGWGEQWCVKCGLNRVYAPGRDCYECARAEWERTHPGKGTDAGTA